VADTLSISQDARSLKIERRTSANTDTAMYRLDGRNAQNRLRTMGGLVAGRTLAFVSRWEASKFVTDITWESIVGPQRLIETLTLEADALVVELMRPSIAAGGAPVVRRTVYTRQPAARVPSAAVPSHPPRTPPPDGVWQNEEIKAREQEERERQQR
jgi:hypothetical protein